ncbi:MAG: Nucleotidyltransferase [Hyphomicrobiales bacterium]|nr:Nucleotidyltransferase [Hyphomicrobiales bacterium]
MWGLIPAAGQGTRIQPLAFSKELLPVGTTKAGAQERPKAISEYLVERMARAGATKACFVIAPGKTDILRYYGGRMGEIDIAYAVQTRPAGLCDALFCAAHLIHPSESVLVGLPDTLWFPEDALAQAPADKLAFLLFPVERPDLFDAVDTDAQGRVRGIEVKAPAPKSRWVWGAFRMPGEVYHALHRLWRARGCEDEYFGTLVNAWIAAGGEAAGVRAGARYVDVGTLNGYREALSLLGEPKSTESPLASK